MIMLCYVTIRQGDYPGGSDLITWGIKSRAPSPADDRRGSERVEAWEGVDVPLMAWSGPHEKYRES